MTDRDDRDDSGSAPPELTDRRRFLKQAGIIGLAAAGAGWAAAGSAGAAVSTGREFPSPCAV